MQYDYFSAKSYFSYKEKIRKRAMLFTRRRGRERLNSDGSTSSELRDRLHGQENKSSRFSRSSGV